MQGKQAKMVSPTQERVAYPRLAGRCFRSVDFISDASPTRIAVDEETDHQSMHGRRFGEANRAAHETFNPGPQIDVFALDGLHVLFANGVLHRSKMALVGPPSIRVKPRDAKRLQETLEFEQNRILAPSKDLGQHGAAVVITGMP